MAKLANVKQVYSEPIAGSSALLPSFQKQIADKHQRGIELDAKLRQDLLDRLGLSREVGLLLEAAHRDLDSQQWKELKASLPFDSGPLQAYVRFAKSHREPITDIGRGLNAVKLALQCSGFLPFRQGHGTQVLHTPNFFSKATRTIETFIVEWKKFISHRPVQSWEPEIAEQFAVSLKPILSIHRQVRQFLDERRNAG